MGKPVKKSFEEPTSIYIWNNLLRYIMFLAEISGANIVVPNYKFNIRTFLVVLVTNLFIFTYFYRSITGMALNEIMEGLTVIIMSIQGMTKLYTILVHRHTIKSLADQLCKLHETNVNNRRNHEALLLCIQRCLICCKLFTISYFGATLIYELLPLFTYLFYGERVLIIPVHLPSTESDTTFGYKINMILQVVFIMYGGTGILGADMGFLLLVFHTTVLVSHFKNLFDDLNEFIENSYTKDDVVKIRNMIREIWKHHLGIIEYINRLNEIYSVNSLFQLFSCASVLTLSLFLIVWEKWVIGPFLVIVVLFQLLEFCVLGTIIQIQNEKIATLIYDCVWYKLEIAEQKDILIMLMQAQNAPELTAGKFVLLNVETCMRVLKAAYSYLMMILEFLKDV